MPLRRSAPSSPSSRGQGCCCCGKAGCGMKCFRAAAETSASASPSTSPELNRVLIIGSPGSGKSTLATELLRRTGLPLVHLDREYWRSGWVETPQDEWRERVAEIVAGERWII